MIGDSQGPATQPVPNYEQQKMNVTLRPALADRDPMVDEHWTDSRECSPTTARIKKEADQFFSTLSLNSKGNRAV